MTEPELLSLVKSLIFASILTLFIFMINFRREAENGFYKNLSTFFIYNFLCRRKIDLQLKCFPLPI